ncbi:CopD family copper resistance protein [Conchiformibius steedae]|uniref:Integral membrane protein n=1 Tax=Conchiformibius steedae TaxID=153493 RepID=A0A3P2A2E3_9NEIS|nr:hypothetical protein [Conchiformibius steedae]RRD89601.1 hypothetical protein EII21_08215 [Conchiformibius steedae]
MNQAYPIAHIIHLFCAVIFVGGVFFEALILSALHRKGVPREARQAAEKAVSVRAVRVMPFVVAGVFVSGLVMAHRYADVLANPFAGAFGTQLLLKIVLALGVLLHFVVAVRRMRRGTLTAAWSRYIHAAVLVQMIAIVLLAKTMFYISW